MPTGLPASASPPGLGIGLKNQNQRQQQPQQEWDAYRDLDRLNTIVEKENEAHDFFGKGLADWKKSVTGKQSARDATSLRKQFDDYESSILTTVPKGGKRHTALTDSLPKIKSSFLKESHQFALDSSTSTPAPSSTRACSASPGGRLAP